MHGRVPAEVRGQGPEGVRGHGRAAPGRCARWHPTLCRDARMCVHACAALPGTTGHAKDKLGLGGGVSVPEGVWPTGSCTPNTTRLHVHGRTLAVSLPRHGWGSVPPCPRCPGWGSPSLSDGGALPGKQEAPPGNEHHRFHSNLKGLQLLPR